MAPVVQATVLPLLPRPPLYTTALSPVPSSAAASTSSDAASTSSSYLWSAALPYIRH
jgi:hypothetical protein